MIIYDNAANSVANTETGNEIQFLHLAAQRDDLDRFLFTGPIASFYFGVRYDRGYDEVEKEFPMPAGLSQDEKFKFHARIIEIAEERGKRRALIELGFRPGTWEAETREQPLPPEITADLLVLILARTRQVLKFRIKEYAVRFHEMGSGRTAGGQRFSLTHQIDYDGIFSTTDHQVAKS